MCKSLQQAVLKMGLNYRYLTNWVKLKNTFPAALWVAARRDPQEAQPLGRLVCRQPAASGETSILLRLLLSVLTHIHSSPPARQNPVPSPTFLPAHLPSLYWAHEGEPVPSGATVQIAVLPPQMDASLLRIPPERVGALLSSTFCLVVVVSNHNACPRLSLTVDIQGSGLHCAAYSKRNWGKK